MLPVRTDSSRALTTAPWPRIIRLTPTLSKTPRTADPAACDISWLSSCQTQRPQDRHSGSSDPHAAARARRPRKPRPGPPTTADPAARTPRPHACRGDGSGASANTSGIMLACHRRHGTCLAARATRMARGCRAASAVVAASARRAATAGIPALAGVRAPAVTPVTRTGAGLQGIRCLAKWQERQGRRPTSDCDHCHKYSAIHQKSPLSLVARRSIQRRRIDKLTPPRVGPQAARGTNSQLGCYDGCWRRAMGPPRTRGLVQPNRQLSLALVMGGE